MLTGMASIRHFELRSYSADGEYTCHDHEAITNEMAKLRRKLSGRQPKWVQPSGFNLRNTRYKAHRRSKSPK